MRKIYLITAALCSATAISSPAKEKLNLSTGSLFSWILNGSFFNKNVLLLLLSTFGVMSAFAQPGVLNQPLDFPTVCQPNTLTSYTNTLSFDLDKGSCGNNGGFTFIWQYNNLGTWQTIADGVPTGFTTYTVTSTSTGSGANVKGKSSLKITLAANAVTGTSQFRCIATLSVCSGSPVTSNTINFTVNPKPTVTFTAQPGASACANTAVTYTTQSGQSSYQWLFPGSLAGTDYSVVSGGSSTDNSVTLKWLTGGSKTVTINYSNSNSCTAAAATSSTATSVSVVTPTFTAQPSGTICSSTDVTYTTQASQSAYVWTYTGVLNTDYTITSGGTAADNSVTVKWLTAGSKTASVNYTAGGCTAASATSSNSITITARPVPTFTASAGANTCASNNVTYTTQSGQTSYVWIVPGTLGTDYTITSGGIGTGSNTVTLKWLTTGSKTVTVNYTSSSCTGLAAAISTTTVNALPVVSFSASPGANTCASTDVIYTTQSGQSNYVWTVEGVLGTDYTISAGGVGTGSNTVTIKWLTAGASRTVTVNYTNASLCTALAAASSTTFINSRPSPTFTTSPGANTCANTDVTYTTLASQASYVWSVPGTAGIDYTISSGGIGPTNNTVTLQWLTSGSKTVTVNYNNSNGCTALVAASTVTSINVPTAPTITPSGTTTFCLGGSVTLTSTSATSYQWYKDGVLIVGATSITYSANTSGSFTIKIFNASGCDATSTGTTVTVNPLPTITTSAQAGSLCFSAGGQTSTLAYSAVTNSPTSYSITWDATATGAGFLAVSNAALPVSPINIAVPAGAAANTYNGTITVANANGCISAAKAFTVTITSSPNVSNFGISAANGCVGKGATITINSSTLVNGTYTVFYDLSGANSATGNTATMSFSGGTGAFLATALSAGSTNITVTQIALVGCNTLVSSGNTATFIINTLPVITPTSGPNKVCIGSNITLLNTTLGGSWSSSNSTVATVNSSGVVTSVTIGTVNIVYTTAPNANGCSDSSVKIITVNALPALAAITGTTSLCINTTTNLADATSGGTWTSSNTTVATVNNSSGLVTGLTAGTSIITYAIPADANGCSNSTSTTITVDPAATADAGTLITVCQSASPVAFTLSGATVGGAAITGAWSIVSGGGALSSTAQTSTPASVTYTPASNYSGPVVLLLTTNAPGSCAAVTSTRNITVSQAPTVTAGSTIIVCQSASPSASTLSGTTLGGGAATAAWSITSGGGTLSDLTQTATPETVTYTPAANYSGPVILLLTTNASGSCVAATASRTITVTAAPTVIAGGPNTVCKGSSAITLTGASFAGGASSAAWSITSPGGGTLSSTAQTASPAIVTYTPAAAFTGTITLTLTSDAPGTCSSVSTTRIINISVPASATAGGPDVACQSASPTAISLSGATVGGGATTGAWAIISGGGALSSVLQTSTPASVTYTPAANYSGAVTVRLTTDIPLGCSVATADRTINISLAPTANAGTAVVTCSDNSQTASGLAAVSITAGASATNNTSVLWSSSGTGTFTNPTSLTTATYTPSTTDKAAGFVTLTLTAFGNSPCGNATSTKTFTITPAIDATAANSWTVLPTCSNQGIVFTLPGNPAGGNGTFSYQWYSKNNCGVAGVSVPVPGATTLSYSPLDGNCYWLYISSGGCAVPQNLVGGTKRENVGSNSAIAASANISFASGGTGTSICIGGSTTIGATSAVSYTYSWSPSTGLNTTTGATVTANPSSTTTYTVTGVATDASGCTKTSTYTVTVNPLPTATISGTTSVCQNAASPNITFTGAAGTAPYTFTYKINGAANQTVTTLAGNSVTVAAPTTFTGSFVYTLVSVQDASSTACSQLQSGTATITVNPLPTATISGTTSVCQNAAQPNITFTGAAGTAPYTFTYKIGAGANQTVTTSAGNSVTVAAPTTVTGPFVYTLVSVQDASSTTCSQLQSGTATITVNPLPTATIGGTTSVCQNAAQPNITFTGAAGTAPYTFTYKIGVGANQTVTTSAGNSVTVAAPTTVTGSFVYTLVSVQDASSTTCSQLQSGTATITVNPLPTATISGTTSVCQNAAQPNITFTGAAGTAPYTFTYKINGGANQTVTTSAGNSVTVAVPTTATGTFVYTLISVQDASSTACTQLQSGTATITVNPLPTATISGTAAVCLNATQPLITFTGANGTAPYTFTYKIGSGANQTVTTVSGNLVTVSAPTTTAGSFVYTLINVQDASSTACTQLQSGTATITVAAVTVAGTLPSVSVCASGAGTLTLIGNVGNVVQWESSPTGSAPWTVIANTTTSQNYTAVATTIYYQAYVQSGTCTAAYSTISTVGLHNVWTGVTSTDWNTPSNWSDGLLPNISCPDVTITNVANKPVLSSGTATINNLVINTGASLTVTGATLQIAGSITNSGGTFNVSNGSLDFNGLASQTISGDMFVGGNLKNLTVNNTVGLNITASPANPLNIIGDLTFGASNGKLNTGDNVVLVSTATTTARVENITKNGTGNLITGKVTVQRYFPALRAWRLITSPLSNTGNIFSTWQNGGVYPPIGIGTLVTGTVTGTGGGGNGLDNGPFLNPSLKTGSNLYDVNDTRAMMLSGSSASAANIGYLMFVRGDRNPINTTVPNTNITTLSSKGNLQTGPQKFNVPTTTSGAYTLIGNPYASPVDLDLVTRNNLLRRFYVWDPKLSSVGAYVLIDGTLGGAFTFSPPNSPGTGNPTQHIQSSEAFFVQTDNLGTSPFILFNESNKSSSNNLGMFRPMNPGPSQSLRTNLFMVNSDGNRHMADGNLVQFDDSYNPGVDLQDALKFGNVNETFGLLSGTTALALDRRPPLANTDTVFFNFAKARQLKYQFEFITELLERDNLAGFVEDKFLHKLSPLNMNGTIKLDFEVTADAASAAIDRFRVVFKPSVVYTKLTAAVLSSDIGVEWNVASELDIKAYDVERSTDGINFTKMGTVTSAGSTTAATYTWLDKSPALGYYYYRIRSISNSNVVGHSNIAKVKINKSTPAIYVFPNPVTENILQLQMNSMPQGVYGVRLMNSLGQAVVTNRISHTAGTATETIRPARKLIAGVYELQVTAPDKKITMVKVIVH